MKTILIILSLIIVFPSCAHENSARHINNQPCMNIPHTDKVIECMINLAEKKKAAYKEEYDLYLKSINTTEERPYNKEAISKLVKEAKKNWDAYTKNECLAESSIYEKGNYSFNDTYNACLIKHYNQRIEYYKNNKF